jgi:hypothetical protein
MIRPIDKAKNDRDYAKYSELGKDLSWMNIIISLIPNDSDGYIVRMMQNNKLDRDYNRSEVEILYEFSKGGNHPSTWKLPGKVDYNINRHMYYASMKKLDIKIPADIVRSGIYRIVGMYAPDHQEHFKIENWKDAESCDKLKDYFFGKDYLDLFMGGKQRHDCNYSGDYEDYVLTKYTRKERAALYVSYLQRNNNSVPVSSNSYVSCLNNVDLTLRQAAMYQEILEEIQGQVDIVSDGAGTCSLACINIDKEYSSEEINPIADVAKKLQIVGGDFDTSHTLIVANSIEYENNQELTKDYEKVVIIEEGNIGDFKVLQDFEQVKYTTGKVWTKGIKLKYKYPMYCRVVDYIRSKEPIFPLDFKSNCFCEENDIKVSQKGFKIATSNIRNAYNIASRGVPSNINVAKIGDIKEKDYLFFEYEEPGQVQICNNTAFHYYPEDMHRRVFLLPSMYQKEGDLYKSEVSNPRATRFIFDKGRTNVAYYLFTREIKGRNISYYSITSFDVKVNPLNIPEYKYTLAPGSQEKVVRMNAESRSKEKEKKDVNKEKHNKVRKKIAKNTKFYKKVDQKDDQQN